MKKFGLFVLIAVVYVLHQDLWNWRRADPLIFGFLPIGLAYHAAYAVVASVVMAILVKTAWPSHLEEPETGAPQAQNKEPAP